MEVYVEAKDAVDSHTAMALSQSTLDVNSQIWLIGCTTRRRDWPRSTASAGIWLDNYDFTWGCSGGGT